MNKHVFQCLAIAAAALASAMAGCGEEPPTAEEVYAEPFVTAEGKEITHEEALQQMEDLEAEAGNEGAAPGFGG